MPTPFSMHQVGSEAMLPPREITVSEWADENVVLSGAGAAERGQWHTRPYQREPMDVLSPSHPCKQVVLMSSAQMLKTSVLVNFLGFIADVDPGPVLVVEPRQGCQGTVQGTRRSAIPADTLPAWKDRSRQVARRQQRRATRSSRTVPDISRSPVQSRRLASPCARSAICCWMKWTATRRAREIGRRSMLARHPRRTGEFRAQQESRFMFDTDGRRPEQDPVGVERSDQREYFVPCPMCKRSRYCVLGTARAAGWCGRRVSRKRLRIAARTAGISSRITRRAGMVERGETARRILDRRSLDFACRS